MAAQPYTVTVPRGQEHLLPFPMRKRAPLTTIGGLGRAAQLAFGKAIEQFESGGAYGKGVEAALERERTKTVAGEQQALVSAGLAGTSMLAAPGQRFAEEVAMPTRAKVEETRAGRLSELYTILAQMTEQSRQAALERGSRFPQIMPRYSMPVTAPITTGDYGYRNIPAPDFSLPVSNRITSAAQRTGMLPVEPFWGGSEKWREEQADWLKGAATWG